MLCRKFKNISAIHPTKNNIIFRPIQTRSFSKCFYILSDKNMSPAVRLKLFRDLLVTRVLNAWTRSYTVNSLFKRCRTDRNVNKMCLYFRQVFFRPRTPFLVSATATFKNTEEKPGPPKKCSRNIKDKEMKRLIKDLDRVEDLSKATLYCEGCDKRIVIDTKHKGVQYCDCPNSKPPVGIYDGWVPYMEAEDVIIWRKEYKPGGLYAYKVYGRYKHLKAEDFAMIQVDGAYRKVWDTAVASIDIVEREANGIRDQTVLHWEVLWPRLFTNRDYVYLRRHKEFNVKTRCLVHKDGIFPDKERCVPDENYKERACNVHSKAKEASQRAEREEASADLKDNKVYVIVSRSCVHPSAPETSKAVRVEEYWSHMVITTLNGPDHPGMEFVLTYYDEPAVGGLPTAVTSWAMGRAGPAFLERMRGAAKDYTAWRSHHPQEPDFSPFEVSNVSYEHITNEDLEDTEGPESMDSPQDSPEPLDSPNMDSPRVVKSPELADGSTQTRPVIITPVDDPQDGPKVEAESNIPIKYASKECPIPINDAPIEALTKEQDSEDTIKYHLTLSTSTPQESEEQLTTLDGTNVHHLKITIQLPMSEINRLAEIRSDDTKAIIDESVRFVDGSVKTLDGDPVNTDDAVNILDGPVNIIDGPVNELDDSVKTITTSILTETKEPGVTEGKDSDKNAEERDSVQEKTSWWRYLYPLYYFV